MSADDVHVWGFALDQSPPVIARMGSVLDAEERARAARFRRAIDRDRYVTAHGALRLLLERYLNRSADSVRLRHDEFGKPFVADRAGLWFNLAHSEGLALLAITRAGEIGVDVERLVSLPDMFDVARVCFAPNEQLALHAAPDSERPGAFLAGWTRKEAYVKAVGTGLSAPLQAFEVSLAAGDSSHLSRVNGSERLASAWTLRSLAPARGYIGAVAIQRQAIRLTTWQFDIAAIGST